MHGTTGSACTYVRMSVRMVLVGRRLQKPQELVLESRNVFGGLDGNFRFYLLSFSHRDFSVDISPKCLKESFSLDVFLMFRI